MSRRPAATEQEQQEEEETQPITELEDFSEDELDTIFEKLEGDGP